MPARLCSDAEFGQKGIALRWSRIDIGGDQTRGLQCSMNDIRHVQCLRVAGQGDQGGLAVALAAGDLLQKAALQLKDTGSLNMPWALVSWGPRRSPGPGHKGRAEQV